MHHPDPGRAGQPSANRTPADDATPADPAVPEQDEFSSPAAAQASAMHPAGQQQDGAGQPEAPTESRKARAFLLQGRPQGKNPDLPLSAYRQSTKVRQWARALGWFSIGLGAAQLLAPRKLARATGVPADAAGMVRAIGAREVGSGLGLLSQPGSAPWVWARVAGDAMDLGLLGAAARRPGSRRRPLALAAAAVAGIAAVDVWAGMQSRRYADHPAAAASAKGAVGVDRAISINRTPDECYRFWRDFENLPRFMRHLEGIEAVSETRSRWRAKAPGGASVEWESELTLDHPGELLAWRSLPGADIDNAGTVSFARASGGRGTVVRVALEYRPPGGKPAALLARLFGEEPGQQVADDLRHFKQLIETGEIATTVGQSAGARSPVARLLRKGEPG